MKSIDNFIATVSLRSRIASELMPTIKAQNPHDSAYTITMKAHKQADIAIKCARFEEEINKVLGSRWRYFVCFGWTRRRIKRRYIKPTRYCAAYRVHPFIM